MILGALTLSASAQSPPHNHDMSNIWSSQDGALYTNQSLALQALEELTPVQGYNRILLKVNARLAQDVLTCEPQKAISAR
jgi:hypothetical protein